MLGTPLPWKPPKDLYSKGFFTHPLPPERGAMTFVNGSRCTFAKGEEHWNPLGPKQRSALELTANRVKRQGSM